VWAPVSRRRSTRQRTSLFSTLTPIQMLSLHSSCGDNSSRRSARLVRSDICAGGSSHDCEDFLNEIGRHRLVEQVRHAIHEHAPPFSPPMRDGKGMSVKHNLTCPDPSLT
jgi:hypothetical protein